MTCATCHGQLVVERDATPAEVDAGFELGVAYDPCPACMTFKPGFKVEFEWCAVCLQGVEYATFTDEPDVYLFRPCLHVARFFERARR